MEITHADTTMNNENYSDPWITLACLTRNVIELFQRRSRAAIEEERQTCSEENEAEHSVPPSDVSDSAKHERNIIGIMRVPRNGTRVAVKQLPKTLCV